MNKRQLRKAVDLLLQQNMKMTYGLLKYSRHGDDCTEAEDGGGCSCGLDALMDEVHLTDQVAAVRGVENEPFLFDETARKG